MYTNVNDYFVCMTKHAKQTLCAYMCVNVGNDISLGLVPTYFSASSSSANIEKPFLTHIFISFPFRSVCHEPTPKKRKSRQENEYHSNEERKRSSKDFRTVCVSEKNES